MNIALLLLAALPVFYLGYRFYGGFISGTFAADDSAPTPAVALKDGLDYVPTKLGVVFSHHFASIAGAGPIIGPTVAVVFGYMPVWLWVVLGCVFIGAVHDYTVLFVSMREKGRSIADIANGTLGKFGFFLFISFTIIMLLFLTAAFLGLTTISLTSMVPLENMKMAAGQTILKAVAGADGITRVQIGGIASTSVIIITLCAPLVGFLLYRKDYPVLPISVLAVVLTILSVWAGVRWPLSLDPKTWMIILTIYCVLAAGLPVWLVLQPRDFINSFFLYLGMIVLFIGVVGGGWSGLALQAPAFNAGGAQAIGDLWPFLLITVACGAISGFHALVAGGTVSKQVSKESHARVVGYGGMLTEGFLAVLVTLTVAGGLDFKTYMDIVYPADPAVLSNPVLAWSLAMGTLLHDAIGAPVSAGTVLGILMVEGFVVTTLDTAVRLNRYLFEELWAMLLKDPPALLRSHVFNSILSAALMLLLCYTNAFKLIWPIFGAANQLLAALGLIVVSIWLAARKKPYLFTLVPALLMMAMTLYALYLLLFEKYLPAADYHLAAAAVALMALAIGVIVLSVRRLRSAPLLPAA